MRGVDHHATMGAYRSRERCRKLASSAFFDPPYKVIIDTSTLYRSFCPTPYINSRHYEPAEYSSVTYQLESSLIPQDHFESKPTKRPIPFNPFRLAMPVRIRLARHGQRHNPFYHLVVIPSTKARDARPIEKLGEYDPIPRLPSTADLPSSSMIFGKKTEAAPKEKKVTWNVERIRYWLDTGAQPTRSVVKLLERVS